MVYSPLVFIGCLSGSPLPAFLGSLASKAGTGFPSESRSFTHPASRSMSEIVSCLRCSPATMVIPLSRLSALIFFVLGSELTFAIASSSCSSPVRFLPLAGPLALSTTYAARYASCTALSCSSRAGSATGLPTYRRLASLIISVTCSGVSSATSFLAGVGAASSAAGASFESSVLMSSISFLWYLSHSGPVSSRFPPSPPEFSFRAFISSISRLLPRASSSSFAFRRL